MLDGTLTRMPDGYHAVRFTRRLAQPPAKVWAMLTEPEALKLWLGDCEVDPRVGGSFVIQFRGMSIKMTGRITHFEPPRRLEYSWHENYGMPASLLRWEIAEDADGCTLTLNHEFPPQIARNDILPFLGGWHAFLDAIAPSCEGCFVPYATTAERDLDAAYRAELGEDAEDPKGVVSQTGLITFRRKFAQPIDKVWAFLAETDKLKHWYGEGVIEPRAGGKVRLLGGHVRGIVTQWQPPHRITYTWNVFSPDDPEDAISAHPESYLSLSLMAFGGTRLTLTHMPLPPRFQQQTAMGWHTFLDLVEAGLDDRFPMRGDFFGKNATLYGVDLNNLKR